MKDSRQIFWVDLTRFDSKPDKSTWLEMGDVLSRFNYTVNLVTSYAGKPFTSGSHAIKFINIRPTKIPGLFRTVLLFRTMQILIRQRDREAIYILPAGALFIAPVLKMFGIRKLHLDVRTVPVTVHGLKKKIDTLIFWKIALKVFSRFANSSSFITKALQNDVERVSNFRFPRSFVWSSGVKTSAFEPRPTHAQTDQVFHFFYHGTITADRGVITMVEAMEHLPRELFDTVKMTIVGSGPGTAELVELISAKGWQDQVHFVGYVDYDRISDFVRAASCCVCPLPDRHEWQLSSPLKILEYLASAKPIIATPIIAHKDVLNGLPFVVWTDGFDQKAIADAMVYAFHNRNSLSASASRGPEFVRTHFDWEILGKRFADHLDHCYGQ